MKYGRHIRLNPNVKIIVGRTQGDNERITEFYRSQRDFLLKLEKLPGPTVLVPGWRRKGSPHSGSRHLCRVRQGTRHKTGGCIAEYAGRKRPHHRYGCSAQRHQTLTGLRPKAICHRPIAYLPMAFFDNLPAIGRRRPICPGPCCNG